MGREQLTDTARVAVCTSDEIAAQRIESALSGDEHELCASYDSIEELVNGVFSDDPAVVVLVHDFEPFGDVAEITSLRAALEDRALVLIPRGFLGGALRKLLRQGIDGVVLEGDIDRALRPTVNAVLRDQLCLPAGMREDIAQPVLSHREKQILELVVQGLTNSEIAGRLYLSESTVKSHLASSFRKLAVSSRAEAVKRVLDPDSGVDLHLAYDSDHVFVNGRC